MNWPVQKASPWLTLRPSAKLRQTITYQNLSQKDHAQGLIQAGLPAAFAEVIADADAQTAKGAMFSKPAQDLKS